MPKILHPKLSPLNSPQFVLALQSPLYQAAHAVTSRPLKGGNGLKPTTRSRAKSVGAVDAGRCGMTRRPIGPVRGMRSSLPDQLKVNEVIRNAVGSDWVNVSISVDAAASAPVLKVPIEVKEVSCVRLQGQLREAKQEIEDEAPLCIEPMKKRTRKCEVEVELEEPLSLTPLSPGRANKRPRIESPRRSQVPEEHPPEPQREAVERAQNFTERGAIDACGLGSRNERHGQFLNCITLVLQESSGFLKESTESGSFQPSYDELRNVQCNAKRLVDEVEQGIHLLRLKELQKIESEKAKAEMDAAVERTGLFSIIGSLKQENASLRENCTKLEMEVDRLSQEKVEAEKKLEAEADKEKHLEEETKELAKKQEKVDALGREFMALQVKGMCQMCNLKPRDGLILPCLHLLYCFQCLEKHKSESKECPLVSCSCKINAVLQCNLTGERSLD